MSTQPEEQSKHEEQETVMEDKPADEQPAEAAAAVADEGAEDEVRKKLS